MRALAWLGCLAAGRQGPGGARRALQWFAPRRTRFGCFATLSLNPIPCSAGSSGSRSTTTACRWPVGRPWPHCAALPHAGGPMGSLWAHCTAALELQQRRPNAAVAQWGAMLPCGERLHTFAQNIVPGATWQCCAALNRHACISGPVLRWLALATVQQVAQCCTNLQLVARRRNAMQRVVATLCRC